MVLIFLFILFLTAQNANAKVYVCTVYECLGLAKVAYSLSMIENRDAVKRFMNHDLDLKYPFDAEMETAVSILKNKKYKIGAGKYLWKAQLDSGTIALIYSSAFMRLTYRIKTIVDPHELSNVDLTFLRAEERQAESREQRKALIPQNMTAEESSAISKLRALSKNELINFVRFVTFKYVVEDPDVLVIMVDPLANYPWAMEPYYSDKVPNSSFYQTIYLSRVGHIIGLLVAEDSEVRRYDNVDGLGILSVANKIAGSPLTKNIITPHLEHPVLNMLAAEYIWAMYSQGRLHKLFLEYQRSNFKRKK